MILYCKIAVSTHHNLKRTRLSDTKFIVIGWLEKKLWFLKIKFLSQFNSQFVIAQNADFENTYLQEYIF